MRFTEAQLDLWQAWLVTETGYSVTKFPTEAQIDYFNEGVTRGSFSWRQSAVGYMVRAVQRVENGQIIQGNGPKATQEVAKAGHNHTMCAATGRLVLAGARGSLAGIFAGVVMDWRTELAKGGVEPVDLTPVAVAAQRAAFDELQRIQDSGTAAEFDHAIREMTLPLHAGAISLAAEYGWPQPGLSSTADLVPWEPPRIEA